MNVRYFIGSAQAHYYFPDFPREVFDIDFLIKSEDDKHESDKSIHKRVEYHIIPCLYDYITEHDNSPDVLLTLKCSHIFWDIKWDKNMYDITFFFEKGAQIIMPLFYQLYDHWQKVHGDNKRSDLTKSGKDFFDNALKTYDHDHLHTIINPHPTYQKVLKDGAEVDVDENKFNSLTYEEKLELVREEVYVMAYERLAGRKYRSAYSWMLRKFIREHAPMWEALFILANYRTLHYCAINYKQIFDNGLSGNKEEI